MQNLDALTTERRWLALPLETNVRELHARTLLAAVAAERGFGVVIGRLADAGHFLPNLPPSVVLQTNVVSTEIADVARPFGHVMTALDEEGLVVRSHEEYLDRRVSVAALRACSRFFAWGEINRSAVISKAPDLAAGVVAAGNPRVDLLRDPLREVFRSGADELRAQYGRFILVNTNFGSYNHELGVGHRRREWGAAGWSDLPAGGEVLDRTLEFQRRLLDRFTSLIESLAEKLPSGVSIILRPHPSERFETWRERLGELRSVTVVHRGSVIPWLLAAEALVHNSCTTGIEAAILGRPSFAYMPTRDRRAECVLPNQASIMIDEQEALVEMVLQTLDGPERISMPPVIETLGKDISNLDGALSSEVIAEHLMQVAPEKSSFRNHRRVASDIRRRRLKLAMRSFASATRDRDLRGQRNLAAYVRKASPGIEVGEVERTLGEVASATGRFNEVVSVRLGPDLVLVGREYV